METDYDRYLKRKMKEDQEAYHSGLRGDAPHYYGYKSPSMYAIGQQERERIDSAGKDIGRSFQEAPLTTVTVLLIVLALLVWAVGGSSSSDRAASKISLNQPLPNATTIPEVSPPEHTGPTHYVLSNVDLYTSSGAIAGGRTIRAGTCVASLKGRSNGLTQIRSDSGSNYVPAGVLAPLRPGQSCPINIQTEGLSDHMRVTSGVFLRKNPNRRFVSTGFGVNAGECVRVLRNVKNEWVLVKGQSGSGFVSRKLIGSACN